MTFDFSSYVHVPRGWKIVRNDKELWLKQEGTGRIYRVTCPQRGEFELFYTSALQIEPEFIRRSDSLYDILKSAGCLFGQPKMTRTVQQRLTPGRK